MMNKKDIKTIDHQKRVAVNISNDDRLFITAEAKADFNSALDDQVSYGLRKYGTQLQFANGRSSVNDALLELADAVQYITQAKNELELLALFITSPDMDYDAKFYEVIESIVYNKKILSNSKRQKLDNAWRQIEANE